jgi:hypothetical protein
MQSAEFTPQHRQFFTGIAVNTDDVDMSSASLYTELLERLGPIVIRGGGFQSRISKKTRDKAIGGCLESG